MARPCKLKSKGKSKCTKDKGLKRKYLGYSQTTIANKTGVGIMTPKTHKKRSKKAQVNAAFAKLSARTLRLRAGLSANRS
jgi:hypothetical protein